MFGERALLDDPVLLDILESPDRDNPWHLLAQMIRWPRLVGLVRQCSQQIDDPVLRHQTISLARYLYNHRLQPSGAEDQLRLFYPTNRVLICALIQKLRDMGVASESEFDYTDIEREEEENAEIISYVQGSFKAGRDPPWKATSLGTFSVLGWGAWYRIQERLLRQCAPHKDLKWVERMRRHCLELQASFLSIPLDSYPMEWHMKCLNDLMIGGPLITAEMYAPPPFEGVHKVFYNGLLSEECSLTSLSLEDF